LAPIYAAGFVTAFGAHAVAANLGGYGTRHHTSLFELGLLLGVYDGAEVVLKPVFGAVTDRVGAKPVLVGGLIAFAVASAGFVAAGKPHWLGLARLGQGAAAAAFSPAAAATVAALGGKKRTGRLFGGYGGAKGVGYLAGPLAGGALVAAGGYTLLFAVLAALAGLVAVIAGAGGTDRRPDPPARSTVIELARQVTHPRFVQPVLVLAVGTAALSAGVGFLPVLGARHHLGPIATGALVSLLAATAAVIQPWAGRAHDRAALPAAAGSGALVMAAAGFRDRGGRSQRGRDRRGRRPHRVGYSRFHPARFRRPGRRRPGGAYGPDHGRGRGRPRAGRRRRPGTGRRPQPHRPRSWPGWPGRGHRTGRRGQLAAHPAHRRRASPDPDAPCGGRTLNRRPRCCGLFATGRPVG